LVLRECGALPHWNTEIRLREISRRRAVYVGLCVYGLDVSIAEVSRILSAPSNAVYRAAARWESMPKKYRADMLNKFHNLIQIEDI
jgi:hypothetical protein